MTERNLFYEQLQQESDGKLFRRRWIPVTDRVPDNEHYVLCTTLTKKGFRNLVIGYYADGRWCCGMNSNVIAWMPLPEPYGGEA